MQTFEISHDLQLVPIQPEDAEVLFHLVDRNREMLREWLPWLDKTNSIDDQKFFISSIQEKYKTNGAFDLAIRWKGKIAGIIGFHPIDWDAKVGSIGYWLGVEAHGNGIVTRAVNVLTEYAFSNLKLNRVELSIATENHRSRRVADRLGFQLDRTKPGAENLYGCVVDHFVYVKHNPRLIK